MVQAITNTQPIGQPVERRPLQPLRPPAAQPAPLATADTFARRPEPSVKAQLQGVWANVVVGDSDRSYLLAVPKEVPAGFKLDESKLDAADRRELATYPHVRALFTKLQYLETTDPKARDAFQDLFRSLRNGDVMLRTYGTTDRGGRIMRATGVKDPSGPGVLNSTAIATTGGAYSHAAIIAKPQGQARPHVIESIFEGGVVDSGPYTFLAAMVDQGNLGTRTAVTLYRPTEDRQEATAAVDFAKSQVGTKYNFAMQPNRTRVDAQQNGWYCSQLVYAAFDQNPAIDHAVLGVKQDGNDASRARLTHALVEGIQGRKALGNFFTNKHGETMAKKVPGIVTDIGASMLQAGPRQVVKDGLHGLATVGRVAAGAVMDKVAPGRSKSPTISSVGGREVPAFVTPGDIAPNDGRKVMTLVFDLQE
jgi:uncharacterized protein YycO